MPHFGLMDESRMSHEDAALLRAKLHVRCGRRRLFEEGKLPEAITTLYDAIHAAMRWYAVVTDDVHQEIHKRGDEIYEDDQRLQSLLAEKGAWDDSLDFTSLERLVSAALEHNVPDFDRQQFWEQVENVLTKLGVMPFDEAELPPEDPNTL